MARQVSEDERRARAERDRQELANRVNANMGNPQYDFSNPWAGNQGGFNQWMQNQSANNYDQYVNQFSQGINDAPNDTNPGVRDSRVAAEAARLEQYRPSPVPAPMSVADMYQQSMMQQQATPQSPMAYSASVPIPAPVTPGRPIVGAPDPNPITPVPGAETPIPPPAMPGNLPEEMRPFLGSNGGMVASGIDPSSGQRIANPLLGTPIEAIQQSVNQMYPTGIPAPTQISSSSSSQVGGNLASSQPGPWWNSAFPESGGINPLLQTSGSLGSSFFQQGSGPMSSSSSTQSSGTTPGATIPAPNPLTGSAAGQGQAGTIPNKKSFGQMQPLGYGKKPTTYQRGVR